jgi:hypothetical protein
MPQEGERYRCDLCQAEVTVTKSSESGGGGYGSSTYGGSTYGGSKTVGPLVCCGSSMTPVEETSN